MEGYLRQSYDIDLNEFRLLSEGINYEILSCNKCDSLYQSYEPSSSLLLKIYDQYINSADSFSRKQFPSEDVLWLYSGEISLISALLKNNLSKIKLLDYACGWGLWAKMARGWGSDVTVLELSESRRNYLSGFGLKVINSLSDQIEAYDFVNCDQVFEHLCNPISNLIEINRCVKKGGIVKISIPKTFAAWLTVKRLKSFERGAGAPPDILAPLEHLNYCNRDGLIQLASGAGFEPVNVSIFDYITHSKLLAPDFATTIKNLTRPFYRRFFANVIFLRKIDSV
jgi:hypothetical protein